GISVEGPLPPEFQDDLRVRGDGRLPFGPRGLGGIDLSAIDALLDIQVSVENVFPLEPDDFPGPHSGKDREADEELLAWTEHFENLLDLFGGKHLPAIPWSGDSGRKEGFPGVQ